jgi:hypothetical protein
MQSIEYRLGSDERGLARFHKGVEKIRFEFVIERTAATYKLDSTLTFFYYSSMTPRTHSRIRVSSTCQFAPASNYYTTAHQAVTRLPVRQQAEKQTTDGA